jgi:hypothetical protein
MSTITKNTTEYKVSINVPFPDEHLSLLVCRALKVDQEPKPTIISKLISVSEHSPEELIITFQTKDLTTLRVAVNSCMEMLLLALQTVIEFRPTGTSDP